MQRTSHRFGRLAGLPARQSRVQRLAVSEAHEWFDGDQSPAKSDAKAAHSKVPPSRRNDCQKDGGSSMEVVSSGVAAKVTRQKVLSPSRTSASSRRRPGKGKFSNRFELHHSDPMILMRELFRLARTLDPPEKEFQVSSSKFQVAGSGSGRRSVGEREFRRPKSEGRKKSEVRGPKSEKLPVAGTSSRFCFRSRELFRSSEFGLLSGFGDSDFGFSGWRMERVPAGSAGVRRLGGNGQATCRRDDGVPRCGS